jgi:hypothetical protein
MFCCFKVFTVLILPTSRPFIFLSTDLGTRPLWEDHTGREEELIHMSWILVNATLDLCHK